MTFQTYSDILRPASRIKGLFYDFALIVAGSILLALSAQLVIPLPFVSVTAQTGVVLLLGALLGRMRGVLCVLTYIGEGLAGLPVFMGGGKGLAHLLGPTGGFLIGFVAAVFIVGLLAEKGWDRKFWSTLLAMFLGNITIYICGLAWLYNFVGPEKVLQIGLFPFIAGDIIKMIFATMLLPLGWKITKHREKD